jgi:uncharacterized protein (DUF1697 family)
MTRYVAFLRGVMPTNAKMPALRACFEAAGFSNVRTILGSGNVAFDARAASIETLARRAEKAMQEQLGRTFGTTVRSSKYLQDLVASEPFARYIVPPDAKRIVTFLRSAAPDAVRLPIERDGAAILGMQGTEAFACYLPGDKGPVFMNLLERTFGKDITTRTLDTVKKCAIA